MMETFKNFLKRFYFKTSFDSEKNGIILVNKFFGYVELVTGSCFQSGPYLDRLFRKLLRAIPKKHSVKNVLLLGLGGGGTIREIKRRYKKARIVAVEYDPIMVQIAKTICLKPHDFESVEILVGDAREVLNRLEKKFDVILVDLFIGEKISPLMETADFSHQLLAHLEKDGYLAVNFFRQVKSISPVLDRLFSRWNTLKYLRNTMAIYRHFGQGNVCDPVPKGYFDKRQSRIHLEAYVKGLDRKKVIGETGCLGVQTTFKHFCTEVYCSDIEPNIDSEPRHKIISWSPYTRTKVKGWMKNWVDGFSSQYGIGVIDENNINSYWKEWSQHARRHREKWLRDDRYEMVDVGIDAFAEAYHASKKLDWLTRKGFVRVLKFRLERHSENVRMYVARDKRTQEIIAGLAVIQYPDICQSVHTVSFIYDKARNTSVGVGLISHWYEQGIKEGIVHFNFGLVWLKGDPKEWKGYSQFKRQFNLYLLIYPNSFLKFFW